MAKIGPSSTQSGMQAHQLMARGFTRQGAGELLAGGIITQANDLTRAAGITAKMSTMPGMGGMSMSFNLQYLQLQQQMQHESRCVTLLSSIMRIKHDTAKNAINNIR